MAQEEDIQIHNRPPDWQKEKKPKSRFWKIAFLVNLPITLILILVIATGLFPSISEEKGEVVKPGLRSQEASDSQEDDFTPLNIESWQEFSDSEHPFSFKYPQGWLIQEDNEYKIISVVTHPDCCQACSQNEIKNYYEFYIRDDGILEGEKETKDALEYLLREWLEFVELEKDGPPMIPGFTQAPKSYEWNLFTNQNVSAVEVNPYHCAPSYKQEGENVELIQTEYVLIDNNYRLYTIKLVSPGYSNKENRPYIDEEGHPLIEIIKSLRFKSVND